MSVSRDQFINTSPTSENIQALVSSSQVIGLTVSTTDCNLNNFQRSLSQLSTISIDGLNNNEPININSRTLKDSYYYFEVEPFNIVGELTGDSCLQTTLNPFIEAIGFENSDYNVLFNNATSSRTSNFIQDVDRVSGAIIASNMQNILEDTAIRASLPDSYYTSLAHTSGRYVGSKTSRLEYGVESAINATVFNANLYPLKQNNLFICSQSVEERSIAEYLYSNDPNVDGLKVFGTQQASDTPSLKYGLIHAKATADYGLTTTGTEIVINQDVPVVIGDIIKTYTGDELMLVENVSKTSNPTVTTITVKRGYYNEYILATPSSWNQGTLLTLVKLISDTIYGTDSSKPYRVGDKKIWVEQTGEVFLTDKAGKIIYNSYTC